MSDVSVDGERRALREQIDAGELRKSVNAAREEIRGLREELAVSDAAAAGYMDALLKLRGAPMTPEEEHACIMLERRCT